MKSKVYRSEAEALAAKWAEGQIVPEDLDERVAYWKSDEAVLDAVKRGDLHQRQLAEERNRRDKAGRFGHETPPFVDRYKKEE